jgi:uncharacterized protein YndB with AHSA1/START domain
MATSRKGSTVAAEITTPSDQEIRIERIFDAPRDRVWQAFTQPELVAKWWGRGNKLDIHRMELNKGGHWRFVEHSAEGDQGFEGEFREVAKPERIVQTFTWDGMPGHEIVDTLVLQDLGDNRTKAVTTSRFHSKEERDGMLQLGMEDGLNQSYQALDRLLETQR